MVRNNVTGELKIVGNTGQDHTIAPMNIITFKLSNVDGDWVESYFTGIDLDKYTVAVIGSRFYDPNGSQGVTLYSNNLIEYKDKNNANANAFTGYNPFQVYASRMKRNETTNKLEWVLHADFAGGSPRRIATDLNTKINGTWEITCLIINNSLVNVLNDHVVNFNGGNRVFGTAPAGL
ncbi:hypothetical protein [uncultured Weeksella sp.]|uniref:hypothetical protein n=1 Tax=uncultured Weeksella sp. TaxID=1161389 RepID=UPI00259BA94D|nr:hypothetical protein [uncultured Weeksella sp.]